MRLQASIIAPVLQKILDSAVSSGEECGCQLALYQHGELLVDLCAGYAEPECIQPITSDSLFPIFSVGKGIASTALHRLVEKGLLSYDSRVGDLWPEFSCQGKEDTLVWHLLSHRAALQNIPADNCADELADWQLMCQRIAALSPAWPPGGKCAYHGITFAWLVGETARRASGQDFRQTISEEILQPLHLQDEVFFGSTPAAERRFVPIDASAIPNGESWCRDFIHKTILRQGFIPSANGLASARALAKIYASLLFAVDGVRTLAPQSIAKATQLCRAADDPLPEGGTWAKFGLGYVLGGPPEDLGQVFGHGGAAGALGLADKKSGLTLGFTKNKVSPQHPYYPIRERLSEALQLPLMQW